MNYKFLRPDEGCPLDDFENKITELAMKVDRDFGSFSNAAKTAVSLLEKAMPNITADDTAAFLKLVFHFKFLEDLAANNENAYLDVQAELNSYITGNFTFDEDRQELIYFDHKDFKNKYPKFNPDGILQK